MPTLVFYEMAMLRKLQPLPTRLQHHWDVGCTDATPRQSYMKKGNERKTVAYSGISVWDGEELKADLDIAPIETCEYRKRDL